MRYLLDTNILIAAMKGLKKSARLARIVEGIQLVMLDAETSQHYGAIRAELERQGKPIDANDTWIAAQGRALGAVVVTDNTSEFSHVPGLVIENWLE